MLKISILLFMVLLSSCSSNHNLVFFTNTTIGLEIGSEPQSGTPVKFVIGYKRQEGVVDPLIPKYSFVETTNSGITEPENGGTPIVMTHNGTAIPDGSDTGAHSVIAKMNFGADADDISSGSSQWFATGKAAELLAQAPGISGAISGDPKNNMELGLEKGNTANFAVLSFIFGALETFSKGANATPEAKALVQSLNNLDRGQFKEVYFKYAWGTADKTNMTITPYDVKPEKHEFGHIMRYLSKLIQSHAIAKDFLANTEITVNGKARTPQDIQNAIAAVENYKQKYNQGVSTLTSNPSVIEMMKYLRHDVLFSANAD